MTRYQLKTTKKTAAKKAAKKKAAKKAAKKKTVITRAKPKPKAVFGDEGLRQIISGLRAENESLKEQNIYLRNELMSTRAELAKRTLRAPMPELSSSNTGINLTQAVDGGAVRDATAVVKPAALDMFPGEPGIMPEPLPAFAIVSEIEAPGDVEVEPESPILATIETAVEAVIEAEALAPPEDEDEPEFEDEDEDYGDDSVENEDEEDGDIEDRDVG